MSNCRVVFLVGVATARCLDLAFAVVFLGFAVAPRFCDLAVVVGVAAAVLLLGGKRGMILQLLLNKLLKFVPPYSTIMFTL